MINTEGREPGDKTRKPETTLEKFFQGVNAERIKFLEEQIELKNELLILCDEREQELIKQLSLTRTASIGETQEQLIAVIMKITPNRTALRKFMRAMCLEFDKRKPEPNT